MGNQTLHAKPEEGSRQGSMQAGEKQANHILYVLGPMLSTSAARAKRQHENQCKEAKNDTNTRGCNQWHTECNNIWSEAFAGNFLSLLMACAVASAFLEVRFVDATSDASLLASTSMAAIFP